jgi:hypothetical protein
MSKRALRIPAMVAMAVVMLFVAATLALPRHPAPVAAAAAPPPQPHQSSDIGLTAQPVALPSASVDVRDAVAQVDARLAVSEYSEKTGLSEAEKHHIAEAASPMAAVTAIDEALGTISSSKFEGRRSK